MEKTTPAVKPPAPEPSQSRLILTAEEWLKADFTLVESEVLIGTPKNALVRPGTKNLVQAPEKAFKTTFLMRLMLGLSAGDTVFRSLPVSSPRRVLYLHGELALDELKERTAEAASGLNRPLNTFLQGKCLDASLVTDAGRTAIRALVEEHRPEILVLDPWQNFIAGAEENSFKEVSAATAFMNGLIAECKVTIFLAIHEGKDSARGARGHSTIAGWRDTLFVLRRTKEALTVKVEPRWASPPPDLKLFFRDGTLWESPGPGWSKQAEAIHALVLANGGKLSREEIALGLGLSPHSTRMAIKRAQDQKAIDISGDVVTLPSSRSSSPIPPL